MGRGDKATSILGYRRAARTSDESAAPGMKLPDELDKSDGLDRLDGLNAFPDKMLRP
jgi:hypothetical protein